jgi:D-alanyl-D-alanine carboxypeptidase/D-alanyl-D-alanine-endopeptidase (penicillin-binding protein 4)
MPKRCAFLVALVTGLFWLPALPWSAPAFGEASAPAAEPDVPAEEPPEPGEEPPSPPPEPSGPAEPPQPPAKGDPRQALLADLDRIFAGGGLPKTTVAARVLLAKPAQRAAEVLYSVRSDAPMIPASTMKLLVTAAAWDRLGPDWPLRTVVGHRAPARRGAAADLVVLGGGDPCLSGRFYGGDPLAPFRQWAATLKAAGLKAFGRVLLDDGLFEPAMVHPNWPPDQAAEWYEAPVAALNLNDNCVDVRVGPGEAPGKPGRVRIVPATGYVALESRLRTAAKREDHVFSLERQVLGTGVPGMRLRAGGAYWAEAAPVTDWRTVPDPVLFFGTALAETLRAEGIAVAGPVLRVRLAGDSGLGPDFTADLAHESRLELACRVANERSQGLYAECLMKVLGAFGSNPEARYGAARPGDRPAVGSWASGRAEIERWLLERELPWTGCALDDGSGLSKANRLTAFTVTEVLAFMEWRRGEPWVKTLAQSGRTGSLRKRMRGTAAEGQVWAKTGYVRGTSALSGYVLTRQGRTIVFSILMNEVPWGQLWKAQLVQDKVCVRLVNFAEKPQPPPTDPPSAGR